MAVNQNVVQKYAMAIFLASHEKKKVKKILADLDIIVSIFQKFHKDILLMNDEIYQNNVRIEFVEKLCKKHKFDKLVVNFLHVIAIKRRFDIVERIVEKFHNLNYDMENIEKIEVTSVEPLTKSHLSSIEKFFAKSLNKKVWVDNNVDPTIIGGIMVKVGSVIFDNSMANKLSKLKLFIEQQIVAEQ